MPTFALTVLRAPKKFYKEVDKARRRFLWAQDELATGGKCKPSCPWVGTDSPCDDADRALFAACTAVNVGDGSTASFWHSSWLNGRQLCQAYPAVFAHSARKNRSVQEALHQDRWVLDLRHGDHGNIMHTVLQLAREIRSAGITLQAGRADTITWTRGNSGVYSTRSAYDVQFEERPALDFTATIWKAWAPDKMKVLLWLLHLDRLWCNDRLQRRGWTNNYFCQLCLRNLESSSHLFWECTVAIQCWNKMATWLGCHSFSHSIWSTGRSTAERVRLIIDGASPGTRKGTRSLLILMVWQIWLERNACTFKGKPPCASSIIVACRRDMEQWRIAGAKCIAHPFGDVP
ncbi:hypothetical protein VPH35_008773 [Triticum aestivum]